MLVSVVSAAAFELKTDDFAKSVEIDKANILFCRDPIKDRF